MINLKIKSKSIEVLKICQSCGAFEYKGAWHFRTPEFLKEKDPREKVDIQFRSCPTCRIENLILRNLPKLTTK